MQTRYHDEKHYQLYRGCFKKPALVEFECERRFENWRESWPWKAEEGEPINSGSSISFSPQLNPMQSSCTLANKLRVQGYSDCVEVYEHPNAYTSFEQTFEASRQRRFKLQ